MDDNKARIITKRASKIRFTISNALGGIGKVEIAIIVIDFLITALIFSFLFKYQIIASVLITIFMWLTSLILMFPTKNGTKLYSVVWTAFKYIFVKKQNNDVLKISQIQKIENNTIKFKHKTSVVYRIEAVDILLANQQERDTPIYKLASIFKTIDIDFEICKIQIPYEFNEQIKNIDNLLFKEKTEFKKTQLTNLKNWYMNLQYSNQKLKTAYFLIITADNITLINQKLRYVINEFDNNIKFIKATLEETSLLVQRNIIPTNNVVDKPHKIRQFANYVTVDNKFISYLTVSQYPLLVPDTWLGFLANLNNVNVNMKVHHISEQEALKLLDRAINRAEIQTTSKTSEEIKYQSYLEHFTELMNMVQNGGETLKMVSVMFICFADTKKELDSIRTMLISEMVKKGFIPDELKFQQLKAYNFVWNNNIKNSTEWWQEMPVISLASSYPFVATPLNDNKGLLLGTNDIDEPISFDIKHRDSFRNSSNALIAGMTGSGKTFNAKKQLNWLYCNNTKLYIIDPEREYHQLANYYGGEIIPIGKSDKALINPLEIFSDDLLEHISLLEQWFKILYPSLTDIDLSLLQQTLLKLYKDFKITDKTELNTLLARDYPTLSHLFTLIEKQEKNENNKSHLYNVLWKLAKGADGALWNGISTLSLKSNLIVFDTHELTSNKNRQNAQLFLMLSFLDKVVKQNKAKNQALPIAEQQWICIAIDEAHLLINENSTLALNFLFEMTKRIRKYNGILYIMTQNINDFMGNANIKTQAQGIINNCLYQFVHHLAASDLQDYDNLIATSGRLNQYQKDTIATAPTGTCLFSIGANNRMLLNVEASEIEQEAFS
ncbi:Mbov_0397 family ICE element conjugal transfer ATPase [Spiroplasma poulsonii]|nr:DUF87 domain-containing protein [Spiroplasma poulsonii]UNF62774.1 DUF87 domain-containing protein [Spiroplasma poulsonii]